MTNYADLSDAEINRRVAEVEYSRGDDGSKEYKLLMEHILTTPPSCCKSWAEMGPIIERERIQLNWTDGGLRPFHPDLIPADHPIGDENSANGVIMIGEKGIITCGTYGRNPKLYLNSGEIILPEDSDYEEISLPENSAQLTAIPFAQEQMGD